MLTSVSVFSISLAISKWFLWCGVSHVSRVNGPGISPPPPPQPHSKFRAVISRVSFRAASFRDFFSSSLFWHYFREVTNTHQSKGLIAKILRLKTSRLCYFYEHDNIMVACSLSFGISTLHNPSPPALSKNNKNIITPPWNMTISYREYIKMSVGGGSKTTPVLNLQKAQSF